MMLAIDTSGQMSGIALMDGDHLLAETLWHSERRHSEQVLPQIDAMCRLVEVTPAHVQHIAVNIGPGSWSGIRVGISIAKGLAIANNAMIIGVNALDVLAWPVRQRNPLTALIALGRGRFATTTYTDASWEPGQIQPHNMLGSDLHIPDGHMLVCEPHVAAILPEQLAQHPHIHAAWPQPRILAELGMRILQHNPSGHTIIEPIYLGDPVQPKS